MRARSPPTSAWGPSISWVTALPMSCSSAGPAGGLGARAELVGHHRGQLGDLDRVGEHVLAVAGAEAQPAEQLDQLGVHALHAGVEHALLTELDDVAVHLGLGLVVGLLDPGRMDAAVLQQLLEREPGDLAPDPVKAREHHGAGRVVDDEVDAGEVLQGADVAALAADDPALHVVGGELHDRHGGLGGVAGGQALHADREDVAHPALGLALGLLLDLADPARRVVPGRLLDLLEQQLLGAGTGQPGQLFEPFLDLAWPRTSAACALGELALALLELLLAAGQRLLPAVQARAAFVQCGLHLRDTGAVVRGISGGRARAAVIVRRAQRRPRSRPR